MSAHPRVLFDAVILAASRGANDPMASAFEAPNKCLIPVAGVPMLVRVIAALLASQSVGDIHVSIEDEGVLETALARIAPHHHARVNFIRSRESASASVAQAVSVLGMRRPVLVTTADHALLAPEMVDFFCEGALNGRADVSVALEHADTLLGAYPDAKRTFIRFSDGGYSGCNLFALVTPGALQAVAFWQRIERERKKPWRLVRAFGVRPLLAYLTGRLSLDQAMRDASDILGVRIRAIRMPFADAAIDVDKPADLAAVEKILAARTA